MKTREIQEAWRNYLKGLFEHSICQERPYLFRSNYCATCSHWSLLNEDGLRSIDDPREYDEVVAGMSGRKIQFYDDGAGNRDVYSSHEFYGWCKRYPPQPKRKYSIIGFRSLFTLVNRTISQKVSSYDFPLISQDDSCGEWRKDDWVDPFLKEYEGKVKPDIE